MRGIDQAHALHRAEPISLGTTILQARMRLQYIRNDKGTANLVQGVEEGEAQGATVVETTSRTQAPR